ncbi:MAG: hypothetical protein AAGD38_18340 [Acidobacteriota bacterium]
MELRATWQGVEDPEADNIEFPPPRARRMHRKIFRRDLLETGIAVLLMPFFGWFGWLALTKQRWVIFAFSVFLVAALVYIPWRLWRERRKLPRPDPNRSVKAYLREERDAMRAQAELLESIWGWYLGPLGVGVIGLYVAVRGLVWQSLAYAAAVAFMYILIGWSNRAAAKKHYRATVASLDAQLAELENGQHGGES